MKLLQLNMHKSKDSTALLVRNLTNEKHFINLLQEPHIDSKGNIPNYPRHINKFSSGCIPRTCIISSKDQNLWLDTRFSSRDITTCLWVTGDPHQPEILISSVYLDIEKNGDNQIPLELSKLVSHSSRNHKPLIICMDSNSHSTLWGLETNNRGEILEEFILTNDLNLENIGKVPTFIGRDCETRIDITLTKNFVINKWKVENDLTLSDHRAISFEIELNQMIQPIKFSDLKAANWQTIRK